ncbi:MAG: hypothetical protein EOP40_19290, partial [Rubrivivax sp.]
MPQLAGEPETVERECARAAADLIHARQTVLPKRLLAPGPDADQLHALLGAAAAAPNKACSWSASGPGASRR